jgi:PAS domain S-box-containing protein
VTPSSTSSVVARPAISSGDAQGRFPHRVGAAGDEQAELFRVLSAHAPVGVFQTDTAGRLCFTNTRWRRIASMLHSEQPRGVWWQMVHPEDRDRIVSQWQSALRHGHEFVAEFRVLTLVEAECWARTRITQAAGSEGVVWCWIGTTEDITALRQAEGVQRRTQDELERRVAERTAQLQAANRELTEFASVVAHDLKAPLRAVSRLAEWLADDYAAKLGPAGLRLCELLRERVRRMHELIEGILAYTRIGRTAERETPVDLNRLLHEVVEFLGPSPKLTVVIPPDLPAVRGIPQQLQQVFQNLLDNAVKYMHQPAGRIEVTAQREVAVWHFAVSDNGPGIPARYHAKIFQIFQRLDPNSPVGGTGLGLALVKRIVESRGGRVWVESEAGRGATFHFTWPDVNLAAQEPPERLGPGRPPA